MMVMPQRFSLIYLLNIFDVFNDVYRVSNGVGGFKKFLENLKFRSNNEKMGKIKELYRLFFQLLECGFFLEDSPVAARLRKLPVRQAIGTAVYFS